MYTLSIMTEISIDQYIPHAESFGFLFTNTLNGLHDLGSDLAYYTLVTMKNFSLVIEGHQQVRF